LLDEIEGEYIFAQRLSEEEAMQLLNNGKISGIYFVDEEPSLKVIVPSINSSILAGILSQYTQQKELLKKILAEHPEQIEVALERMLSQTDATKEVSIDGTKTNGMNQYFYSLIGMACMYGSFLGMYFVIHLQGNLSALGARRCVTPTHKLKILVAEMCSVFMIHFANILILVAYLKFVLGIHFGNEWELILLCLVGSMAGVSLGMVIGSIGKFSEGVKIALSIGISMLASFMAGLMVGGIKNEIEKVAPIINRVNPAALISDACYAISVYDNQERFYMSIGILSLESVLFLLLCFFSVRRERYVSI
jgi:ABC-2 type transport system permease protein